MSKKSRVPNLDDADAHLAFLDAIDRRQLSVAQLTDAESTATLAEVITLVNQILAKHRTQ